MKTTLIEPQYKVDFVPLGDCALLVRWPERIDMEINRQVHLLAERIEQHPFTGWTECIPGYSTLVIVYAPELAGYADVRRSVQAEMAGRAARTAIQRELICIPVVYGGDEGPDLEGLARECGLSPGEVVDIHCSSVYQVYMIGFLPGFPYLGKVDSRIAAPRLNTPRVRVPAGSVGIAGEQTGIYPCDSPGGWRIIGRTEAVLFDALREVPCLLQPGDRVMFEAVKR